MSGGTKASLLGERAQVAVERARSAFPSVRPVLIASPLDGVTEGQVNTDNRRYLSAKATGAGHQLDHMLGAFPEPPWFFS